MAMCMGQLHPIPVYRAVFACELFWCRVSLCAPFTISLVECYFIIIFIIEVVNIFGIGMAMLFILDYTFRLSVTT